MKSPAEKRTSSAPPARLGAAEYGRNAVEMAKFLLGKFLCRRLDDGTVLRARIVETEAYFGEEDTACHAYRGRTPRTDVMYAPGGFAYVYLCYGMHAMLNVVTGPAGHPEAFLVLRRVDALAAKLRAAAPALSDEFARIRPSSVYDRICEIVESQLARFAPGGAVVVDSAS